MHDENANVAVRTVISKITAFFNRRTSVKSDIVIIVCFEIFVEKLPFELFLFFFSHKPCANLFFIFTEECLAGIELPPLNGRGVIGLRWGNTLRQVQEGMRRNKGKLQSGPQNQEESQVSYTYEGKFFEQEGIL